MYLAQWITHNVYLDVREEEKGSPVSWVCIFACLLEAFASEKRRTSRIEMTQAEKIAPTGDSLMCGWKWSTGKLPHEDKRDLDIWTEHDLYLIQYPSLGSDIYSRLFSSFLSFFLSSSPSLSPSFLPDFVSALFSSLPSCPANQMCPLVSVCMNSHDYFQAEVCSRLPRCRKHSPLSHSLCVSFSPSSSSSYTLSITCTCGEWTTTQDNLSVCECVRSGTGENKRKEEEKILWKRRLVKWHRQLRHKIWSKRITLVLRVLCAEVSSRFSRNKDTQVYTCLPSVTINVWQNDRTLDLLTFFFSSSFFLMTWNILPSVRHTHSFTHSFLLIKSLIMHLYSIRKCQVSSEWHPSTIVFLSRLYYLFLLRLLATHKSDEWSFSSQSAQQ